VTPKSRLLGARQAPPDPVRALDHVTEAPRSDLLLDVLAGASRSWLLFGRISGVAFA